MLLLYVGWAQAKGSSSGSTGSSYTSSGRYSSSTRRRFSSTTRRRRSSGTGSTPVAPRVAGTGVAAGVAYASYSSFRRRRSNGHSQSAYQSSGSKESAYQYSFAENSAGRCFGCGLGQNIGGNYFVDNGIFIGSARDRSFIYGVPPFKGTFINPTTHPTPFPTVSKQDKSSTGGVGGRSAWQRFSSGSWGFSSPRSLPHDVSTQRLIGTSYYAGNTYFEGQRVCQNHCVSRGNGVCEDGGSNSVSSHCIYGTDCQDCGDR